MPTGLNENRMIDFYIAHPELGPVVHAIFTDSLDELRLDPEQYIRDNLTIRDESATKEASEKQRKKRQKKARKRKSIHTNTHKTR